MSSTGSDLRTRDTGPRYVLQRDCVRLVHAEALREILVGLADGAATSASSAPIASMMSLNSE